MKSAATANTAAALPAHSPEFLWSPTRNELITTKFMRNRLLFTTLAHEILPRLRAEKNRPLRLLFWACSTGAEPFTLKFLLSADSSDEITGIDFDAEAIQQAQTATYHPDTWTMFFDGTKKLLTDTEVSEFFEPPTNAPARVVAPKYRENVRFLTGDLFSPIPAVPEKSFDLVVCNNLLLHLKDSSADVAFDYLLRYLNNDGLLLVSGCNPKVRAAAAHRLNLLPLPDKLTEISQNWAGVSGAWHFKNRPAWAWPDLNENDPDYGFQAGEIFQRNPKNASASGLPRPSEGRGIKGEGCGESRDAGCSSPLTPTLSPPRGEGENITPKNIIITGSTFWNPGDDFVREGVIRVLQNVFEGQPLNFLFYNFNPDALPHAATQPHSNLISHGDLEKFRDHVDAIVVVGVSAGHEVKPLYRWILANNLAQKVLLISGHYQSDYAAEHIVQEPEASIFRQAKFIIGRTEKIPAFIRENHLPYHRVNCPALLSVREVKPIPADKKIARIGFSIQLPKSLGGIINQDCSADSYQLALETLLDLSKKFSVELVAHHKTEYFYFLEKLRGTGIPVVFSSFYHDLFAVYRRYDLVITTRLHTSLFANGHGIPGIIINHSDRHTHALEGFNHSSYVATRDALEKEFFRWQQADLAVVARELEQFKTDLLARYVQLLRPVMLEEKNPAMQNHSPTATNLEGASRILFVRTDSIGDAVLASAMLEPLKRRHPNAQLAVLCQAHVAELFAASPFVNSVICYDRKAVENNPAERAQILAEIAAFKPDVVLNSVRSRDKFSDDLTLAIADAHHIAIEGDLDNITPADHDAARSRYEFVIPTASARVTELKRHEEFLRGLGVETKSLQPVTWTTPEDELLAEEFFKIQELQPEKTIAVFPGAQHEVRVYRGYADALKSFSGYRFLIFGDESQAKLAEEIELQLLGRTVNLCGRSSLRETIALVKRCALYVGAESAGAHIACAVGVPNVVLLGGGHFARFMPYSPLTSAVSLPLDCFGCNWRCSHKRAHCVKDISAEVFAEAIRQTLEKKSARPRIFLQSSASWRGGIGLPIWKRPEAWLAGQEVEFIEVRGATKDSPSIFNSGVALPLPPLPADHERVSCPACSGREASRVRQSADIVQCRGCETVYLRTRLTRDAMRKLYQSYADEGSHMALPKSLADAETSGLKRDYFLDEILSLVKPGGGFLDVGCGWGAFLLNARSKGFQPRGIELTKACVNYANAQLGISVSDTQLDEAALAPASLRVVTMNHVFEHLPEPRAALKKIFAALEPGGMFCGIVPNFASVCSTALGEKWYWLDPNYHYQHFTPNTLRKILEDAGLVVEKIYTATGDYGVDQVQKVCAQINPQLADENIFSTELAAHERAGRGEEIRFFARKPATSSEPKEIAAPVEECLLIPPLPSGPEPLVTAVVSTYASEKFIGACLENLSRQSIFDRVEVIVVDSGSPENERAIVAEFQKKSPNIRYLRTPRETLYAAWNRALKLARGKYFANVNTDDSLRDDALEILAASLDKHAACAYSYADCAWTTKPNDTFPSTHIVKTVKYPDYAPIETLFYCVTGCLQFFRTETLRALGGYDATLKCAGDYEATLKVMAAKLNAVHVPEVLSLFYQNTSGLTQASNRAALEHDAVMDRYRASLDLANIFQVDTTSRTAKADALALLGARAANFFVPWENAACSHNDFAFACFEAALELDPENLAAGMNSVLLHQKLQRLNQHESELVARWPKMREWIQLFRVGERGILPRLNHAVLGPVYRPAEHARHPSAEQLAREPKALHPWITRIEGRHVYLSEDLFPRPTGLQYEPKELQAAGNRLANLLKELPPFYAHFGGAGDALLLLAAFYDQRPDAVLFSHPNGVGAARALFDAFPKLSKIYFLPQHTEPFFHIVLRFAVYELKNCLGAGATPQFGYEEEWKAGLDITKKYRVKLAPRWAKEFCPQVNASPNGSASGLPRPSEGRGIEGEGCERQVDVQIASGLVTASSPLTPALSPPRGEGEKMRRVAVAPKGSLSGMVGSKRNIILPEQWPQVIAHIIARGFEPVILGTPNEAKEYPALPGCVDVRKESFPGQMRAIGGCAGLVGADSWAKSFSALAELPTLVFEPIKGADLISWKDPSDWVFIEPWPSIKMISTLEDFRKTFDARIAKISGAETEKNSKPVIAWEGSFLDYGSLSHINRELTARLPQVTCVGSTILPERAKHDADMKRCAKKISAAAPKNVSVTVRHQWPPNWSRPESGSLVVIQPWEYGHLPQAWVAQSADVDEFWVPSPLVRHMYVDSGVAPEKVRVMPNGVDTTKFHPQVKPLKLSTKKKFKFLFVGGTIHRKGPDVLLEAFTHAFTAADDVCLVIKDFGGDSCYQGQTAEEAIKAIQQKPNAPEILYLKEELSSEQMPSLYAACDCLVLPYRGEGFGMPVLEAMSCGLPVIVTAGGATDSFVNADCGWKIPARGMILNGRIGDIPLVKTGWLLEPSKPHLVAAMKAATANRDECRRRGLAGRGIVERRFDWNDIAAMVSHRLRELAERVLASFAGVQASACAGDTLKRELQPAVATIGRLDEARELLAEKKFEAAWNAGVAAIAQRPFHPEAFLLLAETALAAGDSSSAKQCAEHSRALAPGFEPAKKFLKQKFSGEAKTATFNPASVIRAASSPRVSVCLITKNEEKFLAPCLKSVRGLATQIIVADTGSTDRTVEIAREFGAEIYSFAWCDDFASARNAAIEHATGDWILILDADEELPVAQHAKLLAELQKADALGYRLPLVNAGQEIEGRSFIPRLFRNAPGVFFQGRIHEQVFPSLLPLCKKFGMQTTLGSAEILHHGYTKEMVRDRNKIERNLHLLKQAIAENPADANLIMNLGLELVRSEKLPEGIAKYREAFTLMSRQPTNEVVPELREALLSQFTSQLYKIRGHEEVTRVLNSPLAKNGGLTASLHLALGLSWFELKNYSEAAKQMRECIAKRLLPALTPVNVDIHTAAPWHCLALCQMREENMVGAEQSFEQALKQTGRANEARVDYAKLLAEQDRAVEALKHLHAAITDNAHFAPAWRLGGQIALGQAEFLEFALDWTGEALKNLPDDPLVKAQRAEALLLAGQTADAAPVWQAVWERDRLPRSLAALTLCRLTQKSELPVIGSNAEQEQCSRAFIGWYQKLLAWRAVGAVEAVNAELRTLRGALPTASSTLEMALAESAEK